MGLLSDFFIADADPIPAYQGGKEFGASDKCQLTDLSPLQAAQFLAVLRGCEYDVSMIREFKLVTPEDAEDWTMIVPSDMVHALATIESTATTHVAARFAEATREELDWTSEDFVPIVAALSGLARRAVETKKSMYLWNCV